MLKEHFQWVGGREWECEPEVGGDNEEAEEEEEEESSMQLPQSFPLKGVNGTARRTAVSEAAAS